MDTLGLAHLQPDFPDGLSLRVAAPFESDDRRGVDQDPFRHRTRRSVVAPDRGDLCVRQHHRILHLWLQGHRQVCGDVSAVASLAQRICIDADRDHGHLCDQGRHDQCSDHRSYAVHNPIYRFVRRGHHCHAQGGAGYSTQDGTCWVGSAILRLAPEPGLVHAASLSQRQDCSGRLRSVRLLCHDAVFQGSVGQCRGPRAQLRHAARAGVQESA